MDYDKLFDEGATKYKKEIKKVIKEKERIEEVKLKFLNYLDKKSNHLMSGEFIRNSLARVWFRLKETTGNSADIAIEDADFPTDLKGTKLLIKALLASKQFHTAWARLLKEAHAKRRERLDNLQDISIRIG